MTDFQTYSNIKIFEHSPSGSWTVSRALLAEVRTNSWIDMSKSIVAFRNFSNACKVSFYIQIFKYGLQKKYYSSKSKYTRCGNKETGFLLLVISGQVDDEEEGRELTRGLHSTVTQRFIHGNRLVWPWPLLEADRVSELRRNNAEC